MKSLGPKKNVLDGGTRTTVENKLTMTALNLSIAFEYGVNFKERTITISTDIDESLFTLVDIALTEMEAQSKKAVTIRINSPGGDTYAAMAIVGRIKNSKCQIITEGYGHIMSAGTILLSCGDKRKVSQYAWFMHHEASYGVEGRHSTIKSAVNQMEKEERAWNKWMAQFTKRDEDFWNEHGIGTDAYFTPDQLIELGVADEII